MEGNVDYKSGKKERECFVDRWKDGEKLGRNKGLVLGKQKIKNKMTE